MTGGSGTSRMSGGPGSDNPQSPEQKMWADTVTRLSMSNAADDGTQTMTARVAPAHRNSGAPAATGTVEFTVDNASSGPVPLSGGRASVQVELTPGDHVATAKYSGDAEHAPSDSGPVTVSAA